MGRPSGQPDEFAAGANLGKEYGLRWGHVLHNADPDRLGRCKLVVPGLLKETNWAWPIGMLGAGYPERGGFTVPKEKATVLVGFIQGDVDHPYYMTGPYGLQDGRAAPPTKVQGALDKFAVPDTHVILETDNFEFYIVDSDTEQRIVMQRKGGDKEAIAINLKDKSVRVTGEDYLVLHSDGLLSIEAPKIQIKGRIVSATGQTI